MNEPSIDDVTLVDAIVAGNGDAAHELYTRHHRAILRFAVAMTNSRAAAEDIVHDTFVELLYRPGNYDPARGSLRAFLYGVARHRIANSARRSRGGAAPKLNNDDRHHRPAAATEPPQLAAAILAGTPEDQMARAQEVEYLRKAINALPLVYREVIAWCDLEEVPYATVADVLACPIGTVRSRLHRARALLAETLRSLHHPAKDLREADRGSEDSAVGACSNFTPALKGDPS
jgi:RNA polymerase sigma-70 factor (ECF subfamily)